MIPWKGNTGAAGLVPHLSYVKRKPEPLGIELKTVCDCSTGSWFASMETLQALREKLGVHFVGVIKTGHKGYPLKCAAGP